MTKFKLIFNKDECRNYLNAMSGKGYAMTGFRMGFWSFEECTPGEYTYQVDFTKGLGKVTKKYREFASENGAEIVEIRGLWVYLRKPAAAGDFKPYTNVESTITYYEQLKVLFKIVTVIELICLLFEVMGLMMGNHKAMVSVCLIAALSGVLIREILRINEILYELKSRIGQDTGKLSGKVKGNGAGFLSLGFVFNAIGFAIQDVSYSWLKILFHCVAIVFWVMAFVIRMPRKKD